MERYKDFVRRNAGLVSLFETGACVPIAHRPARAAAVARAAPSPPLDRPSPAPPLPPPGLSSLTWLLPERFAEGELSIEALHTALGLLSAFHDSVAGAPAGAPAPPGADLALALAALEQAQVLLELLATRREEAGRGSRYTPLAALEAVKCAAAARGRQGGCSGCKASAAAAPLLPPLPPTHCFAPLPALPPHTAQGGGAAGGVAPLRRAAAAVGRRRQL